MKILMLNYEFPPLGGGASPVSYEVAKNIVQSGHQVDVVTMGFKGLPKRENVDKINIYRVPCIRKKKEICHTHEMLTFVISAIFFLNKFLKKNKYDICHCHFLIPTGIVALWLKKRFGLDYIITSHGSDIPKHNTERFQLQHKILKPLLTHILNNSSGAFTGSQYLANKANEEINSKIKHKVIRQGFDTKKFTPKEKKKIILATGRLNKLKGFQYLIKAVSAKDFGYELHICGDGPMMQELKNLAQNSKTNIVFHGWVNNKSETYKNLLETASIYCLPSSKENASVSLLEAMSAGCAVITTNVSGCPETVGQAGIVVKQESPQDLKKALETLINNPSLIKKYGKLARERIVRDYSWDKNIKKYLYIYKNIVQNKK